MNYVVIRMPSALAEVDEAYRWLSGESPEHAPGWYNGLLEALYSLEAFPRPVPHRS